MVLGMCYPRFVIVVSVRPSFISCAASTEEVAFGRLSNLSTMCFLEYYLAQLRLAPLVARFMKLLKAYLRTPGKSSPTLGGDFNPGAP